MLQGWRGLRGGVVLPTDRVVTWRIGEGRLGQGRLGKGSADDDAVMSLGLQPPEFTRLLGPQSVGSTTATGRSQSTRGDPFKKRGAPAGYFPDYTLLNSDSMIIIINGGGHE